MIDNEKIKSTIEHFREQGYNIRVRDIAYTLLSEMFADNKTAYQCLFGGDCEGYDEYSTDGMRDKLKDYLEKQGFIKSISTDADTGGISFEENKREMEALLVKTQQAMDDGLVDPKDGLKIMADVRVKLNDKFKIERQQQERVIVVEKKFNHICDRFHVECYLPTKEDLMEMYNLTEKQQ